MLINPNLVAPTKIVTSFRKVHKGKIIYMSYPCVWPTVWPYFTKIAILPGSRRSQITLFCDHTNRKKEVLNGINE